MGKRYKLIGVDGQTYESDTPGALGGHRRLQIYGRLDCRSALGWIARGKYVEHRVFFRDEKTAIAAGYRPCGKCMKTEYDLWKAMLPKLRFRSGCDLKQFRSSNL
jgi:hypothetical protein